MHILLLQERKLLLLLYPLHHHTYQPKGVCWDSMVCRGTIPACSDTVQVVYFVITYSLRVYYELTINTFLILNIAWSRSRISQQIRQATELLCRREAGDSPLITVQNQLLAAKESMSSRKSHSVEIPEEYRRYVKSEQRSRNRGENAFRAAF